MDPIEAIAPPPAEPTPEHQSQDPSRVTFEQAMSYAMSAQYMAGYWMGVAQSKKSGAAGKETNVTTSNQ